MVRRILGVELRGIDTAKVGMMSRTGMRTPFNLGAWSLLRLLGLSSHKYKCTGHCFKTVMALQIQTRLQLQSIRPLTWMTMPIYPSRRRTSKRCLVHSMQSSLAMPNWTPKNYSWPLKLRRTISKAPKTWMSMKTRWTHLAMAPFYRHRMSVQRKKGPAAQRSTSFKNGCVNASGYCKDGKHWAQKRAG